MGRKREAEAGFDDGGCMGGARGRELGARMSTTNDDAGEWWGGGALGERCFLIDSAI